METRVNLTLTEKELQTLLSLLEVSVKVGGFQDNIADNAVYFKNKLVTEYNKVKETEDTTTTTETVE
tara:strand:- start:1190 stop:1390 length:201 start_codon:yes stop_codon:yes gene_type:complete